MTNQNLPAHILPGATESSDMPSYRPTLSDDVSGEVRFRPIQIKIMQPTTPEVAANEISSGVYASSLTGELGAALTVVPLKQGEFRIMNNPTKKFGENEIVCIPLELCRPLEHPIRQFVRGLESLLCLDDIRP